MKCDLCAHDRECQTITVTAQEQSTLIKQGLVSRSEFHYCAVCLRMLQDPERGPLLMSNLYERQLRLAGVPNASELVGKYRARLKELQRKAKHETQS